jgi:hypothetical protein
LLLAAALGVASVSVSRGADANGRYPLSNQLVVGPKDSSHIAVRATFGLVLSADQGKSWSWVCEAAAQFVNGEDPPIALSADNSVVVSSSIGFTTSPDFGCNWALPESDQAIVDADVDRSQPNRVVTSASRFADGKYSFALRQSVDNGVTWDALGVPADGFVLTLAVAPSQPKRVYVSTTSLSEGTPSIVRTDDDGKTWHASVLPTQDAPVPYIAAIDPLNADRVYVRAPSTAGGDVLLVSENAGQDWKQILKAKGTLAGFALSPDGAQLAVGGPTDGVQLASTTDYALTPVNELGVTCLTWTSAGIFACADQGTAGFSVGLSTDEGASFEPLFDPKKLTLKVCEAETPVAVSCPNAWRGLAPILGADPSSGYPEGGSGGSGGSSAMSGGATSEAGTAPSGGSSGGTDSSAGASVGGSAPLPMPPSSGGKSSGCSVAVPTSRFPTALWLGLAVVLARRSSRPRWKKY